MIGGVLGVLLSLPTCQLLQGMREVGTYNLDNLPSDYIFHKLDSLRQRFLDFTKDEHLQIRLVHMYNKGDIP
jgi:hypothetical protein